MDSSSCFEECVLSVAHVAVVTRRLGRDQAKLLNSGMAASSVKDEKGQVGPQPLT